MSQPTSTTIISAYRATSVVDTPMRKVEVLEEHNGRVVLRATEFRNCKADVYQIHLEHHEAQALAHAILNLEDHPDQETPTIREAAQPVLSTLKNTLDSIVGECMEAVEGQLPQTRKQPFTTVSLDKL